MRTYPPPRSSQDPFDHKAILDPDALREALSESEFTIENLSRFARVSRPQSAWDMTVALLRTKAKPRLHSLIRLFLFGRPVERDEVHEALGAGVTEQLLATGVLFTDADKAVRSECTMIPYEDSLIVHDTSPVYTRRDPAVDHVIAVGDATMVLASITPRVRAATALDLGTGSGFQALLASGHVQRVVATDVNPRALSFARLSMALNHIDNVELRQGSFFEPVAEETFDLIVSNPPFVISPDTTYVYRDSDREGDDLAEEMIRLSAGHLAVDGTAVMLLNWTHDEPNGWAERAETWARNTGCDLLLLRFITQPPLDYAAGWLSDGVDRDPQATETRLHLWLDYFEKHAVRYITWAGVLLRKKTHRPNWVRSHTVENDWTTGSRDEQIRRLFANIDLLEGLRDDRALLDVPLVLAPEHILSHSLEAERGEGGLGGGWKALQTKLHLTHGFEFTAKTDRNFASVLALCDGQRPFRAAVHDFARQIGRPPAELEGPCLEAVRPLLEGGFLQTGDFEGCIRPGKGS
jgi:hypothetical protein